MTRGRPPRAAAPSSATHVVLLLAVAAAAASLPAANAAISIEQFKSTTEDIHFYKVGAETAIYLKTSVPSETYSSDYSAFKGSNPPTPSALETFFNNYGTVEISNMQTLQGLTISYEIFFGPTRYKYTLSFHCGDSSNMKSASFFMPQGNNLNWYISKDYPKSLDDLCVPPEPCPALDSTTYSGHSGNCTTGETEQGGSCELTCPSGSTFSDGSNSKVLQCEAGATELTGAEPCTHCDLSALSDAKINVTDCGNGTFMSHGDICHNVRCNQFHHACHGQWCSAESSFDQTLTCSSGNLTWSSGEPTCVAPCQMDISNAKCKDLVDGSDKSYLRHLERCTLVCDPGYHLADGLFSNNVEQCYSSYGMSYYFDWSASCVADNIEDGIANGTSINLASPSTFLLQPKVHYVKSMRLGHANIIYSLVRYLAIFDTNGNNIIQTYTHLGWNIHTTIPDPGTISAYSVDQSETHAFTNLFIDDSSYWHSANSNPNANMYITFLPNTVIDRIEMRRHKFYDGSGPVGTDYDNVPTPVLTLTFEDDSTFEYHPIDGSEDLVVLKNPRPSHAPTTVKIGSELSFSVRDDLSQYIIFERSVLSNYLVAGELEIFCDGVQVPINQLSIAGDARNLLDGLTTFINNVNETGSEARLIDGRRPDTSDWSEIGIGSTWGGENGNQIYGRHQTHPSGYGSVKARIVVKMAHACKVTDLKYWGRTNDAGDTWEFNDFYAAATEQDVKNNKYQWKISLNDIKTKRNLGTSHCYSGCDVQTPIELSIATDISVNFVRDAMLDFNGLLVPYPFKSMYVYVKDDENVKAVVDGTLYQSSSPIQFSIGPITPQAKSSLWEDVSVNSASVFGSQSDLLCGDGVIYYSEKCDDGNNFYGDGCNPDCTVQVRYECTPQPLASEVAQLQTTDSDFCELQGTVCGDGFVDNSAYFHKQQQYRRVAFSDINISSTEDLYTEFEGSPGHDPINIFDPSICATTSPSRVNSNCTLRPGGSGGKTYVTWTSGETKTISKLVLSGTHYLSFFGFQVKFYPSVGADQKCSGSVLSIYRALSFHDEVSEDFSDEFSSDPSTYTNIQGTDTVNTFTLLATEVDVGCIEIYQQATTILVSAKIYEAVGHAEECDPYNDDGSIVSYCDPVTCQLTPDAYCKPRPDPIPTLLFSAKYSQFEHNSMYGGIMTSAAGPYDYWPRLVSSSADSFISPANVSNKIVLRGYDVQPAGGKLLIGDSTGTWFAIIKITPSTTKIASFIVNADETLELVYDHGDGRSCPNDRSPGNDGYDVNCPQLKIICPVCSSNARITYTFDPTTETMVALSFFESNDGIYKRVDVNFGNATKGVVDTNDFNFYGTWTTHSTTPSDTRVYLKEIHISNFEYMKMSAVYQGTRLIYGDLKNQLNHHDTYGAGRDCTDSRRPGDGVFDLGAEEECDDGNLDSGDGCDCEISSGVAECVNTPNINDMDCPAADLWAVTDNITTVAFTAHADAKIEEVQFFAPGGQQIKVATASQSKLADGVWNTPGSIANLSAEIHGASFTFDAGTKIEYIRLYNSRSNVDNSHKISTISVSVNGAVPFNVGFSKNGEWTCSNSDAGYGTGDCTDSKYIGFVDLVHDAQQTKCRCDVNITNGQCGSYSQYMPIGQSCSVTCTSGYSLPSTAGEIYCNANFKVSDVPQCYPDPTTCLASTLEVVDRAVTNCTVEEISVGETCGYTCTDGAYKYYKWTPTKYVTPDGPYTTTDNEAARVNEFKLWYDSTPVWGYGTTETTIEYDPQNVQGTSEGLFSDGATSGRGYWYPKRNIADNGYTGKDTTDKPIVNFPSFLFTLSEAKKVNRFNFGNQIATAWVSDWILEGSNDNVIFYPILNSSEAGYENILSQSAWASNYDYDLPIQAYALSPANAVVTCKSNLSFTSSSEMQCVPIPTCPVSNVGHVENAGTKCTGLEVDIGTSCGYTCGAYKYYKWTPKTYSDIDDAGRVTEFAFFNGDTKIWGHGSSTIVEYDTTLVTTTGGTFAAGDQAGFTKLADNVFGGNDYNRAYWNQDASVSFVFTLFSPQKATKFRFANEGSAYVKTWKLEASNNKVDYTTLIDVDDSNSETYKNIGGVNQWATSTYYHIPQQEYEQTPANANVTCQNDGSFSSSSEIQCLALFDECTVPANPGFNNTEYNCTAGDTVDVGTVCTVSCDSTTFGRVSSHTCTKYGSFSGNFTDPICTPTPQCTAPSFGPATSECVPGQLYNEDRECVYTCPDSGYTSASQTAYTCDGSATQFKAKPIKVTVTTTDPKYFVFNDDTSTAENPLHLLPGTTYTFEDTTIGSHGFAVRIVGGTEQGTLNGNVYTFTPTAGNDYQYYCKSSHLQMTKPIMLQDDLCEAVTCPGNPSVLNTEDSAIDCANHNTFGGGDCQASCETGYQGSASVYECGAGSTWETKTTGTCEKITCSTPVDLSTIPNASSTTCDGTKKFEDTCAIVCAPGYQGGSTSIQCQADGTYDVGDVACTDIPFTCQYGGTKRSDESCACEKGYYGNKCQNLLFETFAIGKRANLNGQMNEAGNFNLGDNYGPTRKVLLSTDFSMPEFNVYAMNSKAEANIHTLFPTKTFKSLLRFETVGANGWNVTGTNDKMTVKIDKPTDYDPSNSPPIFGVHIDETSGDLTKLTTRFIADKIEFDLTHFSLYGTTEYPPICNNSQMEQGETCDDGNNQDGDGCSSTCTVEQHWSCTGDFNAESVCTKDCSALPACPAGQYRNGCVEDTADHGTCTDCTNAGANQYYTSNGGLTSTCTAVDCPVDDCSLGQYRSGCGGTSSGQCTNCENAGPLEFYSGSVGFSSSCEVTTCDAGTCSNAGKYLGGCGNGAAGACADCTPDNDPGARYLSAGAVVNDPDSCTVGKWNDGVKDLAGPNATAGASNIIDAEQCENSGGSNTDQCTDGILSDHYQCQSGSAQCTSFDPKCGSGVMHGEEQCDDGNTATPDGCSPTCTIETGYQCTAATEEGGVSVCTPKLCGDGEWAEGSTEKCDDGNDIDGDGCEGCEIQSGYGCTRDEDTGQTNTTCYIIVLTIDDVTGCATLTATSGSTINYAGDHTVAGLEHNRSTGGDVENCFVCENPITIQVPAFDASNVLADMPVFKGSNCLVQYAAADDADDDAFMCPPFAVGDGRMTANEQCDDGNAIDGDGCSSAGVLQHVQSTESGKSGETIYGSQNLRDANILRYQAIQGATPGDGYISGTETYDTSASLTDNCGSDVKVPERCPNAGNCVADGNVNMCNRKSIADMASYEVFTNGWKAPDHVNDKAARIDIFKSGATNEFDEDIYVQVLDQHPSEISPNLLVQTTKARVVVIQCVVNENVEVQSTAILDEAAVLAVPYTCDGSTHKTCKLSDSDLHSSVFVAGDADNAICGLKTSTSESGGTITYGYDKIRVYVLAEQSGNVYVKHTVRYGGTSDYIDYPSLVVLNFRAHVTASDITAFLSVEESSTSLNELTAPQTVSATYSQTVQLDALSDAKFVRTVRVHAHNAERYDSVTRFSSSQLAEQNGKQTMYFGSVADGAQDATSVFTIPAYENSPAQLNLLKFDSVATLYSCDQFDGSTAYTPVTPGSVRAELTYYIDLNSPEKRFNAFNFASRTFTMRVSPNLASEIQAGQTITIFAAGQSETRTDTISSITSAEGSYKYTELTIDVVLNENGYPWGFSDRETYTFEFSLNADAGRFAQFVTSDPISIQSVPFEYTAATESYLTYTRSSTSINEGTHFTATFTWAPTGDDSLTRTWENIECCDSGRDGFSYPAYELQTTSDLTLENFENDKCFRVKSSLELYDTDGRNAQLAGSGITVKVTPCEYASVDVTLKCRVKVTEPKIQNSLVSDGLQSAAESASRFQYDAVAVNAIVQSLNVAESFTDNHVFTLRAGDPSSTVDVKVCTYVNDLVRSSACDESEYVHEAKLLIDGLTQSVTNGNSYWVVPEFLSHGNALSTVGSTLVADPTFGVEANQTVCFTYTLSASSRASTCGTSQINLTRSHAVKEDLAPADTVSKKAYLKIDETTCAVEIEPLRDVASLDEDTPYALKDVYRFRRNDAATCGKHEEIRSVYFTIDPAYKNDVIINGQSFDQDNRLDLALGTVQSLGDKYSNDWKYFEDGVDLSFADHFNTKGVPEIDLTLHIVAETCDGADPVETLLTRKIGINARTDFCYQDAVSDAIENSNRVKAGNVIDQHFNATLSHIDERRSYKLTVTSNVPLSYQINRDGELLPCGSNSYYTGEVTCTLYCSPDGTNPSGVSDAETETYWDDNLQCKYLKNLLLVPLYVESATSQVDGFDFNCATTVSQQYCTADSGGTALSKTSNKQPYDGYLYLKFASSISDDQGNTTTCFDSGRALHRYDIAPSDIVGEVTALDGSAAVSVYDSTQQLSIETFNINGSQLNSDSVALALARTNHSIYNKQENGMYIALNISSNDCVDEDGALVSFELQSLNSLQSGTTIEGFILDKDSSLSTTLKKTSAAEKHVISNCQIVIDAEENGGGPVFAPFYTTKAQFKYNVQASLGKAVVQLGGAYTPFDTGASSFTLYIARIDGSDGILDVNIFSDVSTCQGSPSSSFDGADSINLIWGNGETDIKSATVNLTGAADCAIKFKVGTDFAESQNEGQPGETWLTGELGSLYIAYSDGSADFASSTLLLGARNADGQEFMLNRTKYEKTVKVELTSTDGSNVVITPDTLTWNVGENDGKTFRIKYNVKTELAGLTNLRINAQMKVPKPDTPDVYDTNAGGQRLLTDETSQQIPIVHDLSGPNACQWGKIESVATTGDVVAEAAEVYSSYVDGYVKLTEGAEYFVGNIPNKYTLEVRRPASKEGDIKFKLNIANFNHASTGVFALTKDKLQQSIDNGAFEDFGDTITMSGTTTSISITIQVREDDENNGMHQLALLFISFEEMRAELPPDLADEIVDGCNANAAAGTSLNFNVQDEIQQATSARRLLSVVSGRRDTTILKVDDDINEPFRQVQTSEDFAVEYWSNATLLQWDAAMDVGIQFDVPNYGDKPFGAWAQIGKCPTNVDTMFINRSSCSTFVPLANPGTTAIDYVRRLVGLDPSSNSTRNCTGVDFPCNHRYSMPTAAGFATQSDMNGHTITIDADGNTRPVYPYKYQNSLTELEKCVDYEGNAVVSTTSSGGDTAYTFKTCIVTYSPRFEDRTDSDVILKTAEQTVMLSSTNEAVVTAIMFETSDSIRVSMVPRQKSCLSDDQCVALSGYECDHITDHAFLELETVIDVPVDEDNTYGYTGPVKIGELTEATNGGCHYELGAGAIVYAGMPIGASEVTKQIDGQSGTTKYARVQFYLRTPCFSAQKTDGSIVNNIFSTCPSDPTKNTNYDFKVQMASCKTITALDLCASGGSCDDCVMTGNRQELTVIKSDVTFIEQLPSVNLGKKTAMQLVPQMFKYGSSSPVDYSENGQSFTTKDTLVLAIRPQDSRSFSGEQFALTCPDKYLAAYNPISPHCTTSQAVEWTYTAPQSSLSAAEEEACDNGQTCKECEDYDFPLGLAKQSVLFDGARKVRICANRTHVLRTHEVAMLDFVHMMWLDYYENDWRANPDHNSENNCETKGSCRQRCIAGVAQKDEGCGSCMNAGAFGAGQWVLPILAATPLVRGGQVVEQMASLIVDDGSANVQVCKHSGAQEGNPDSYGSTTGYDQHNVCNSSHPLKHANKPRYCGFPGLTDSSLEFSPQFTGENRVYVSAGISLFCGALLPDRLYSISAHCYITNCQADSDTNSNNYVRRLLQFAEEHDVVVDSIEEERHVPAAGAKFFKIEADTTTTTASDSDVIGLGSTIAITLGVVALVVIGLMSVSWIYLYRRAYGPSTALPMTMPVQQQQRQPLLYQSGAQSGWNF